MAHRIALAAALVLAAIPAAQHAAEISRARFGIMEPRQQGMAALYAGAPTVPARYAAAMMRYQGAAQREDFFRAAYPLILSGQPLAEGPWTWTAADGSTIRRLRSGVFRITFSSLPGNWFFHFDCTQLVWPLFTCGDSREREMSAPDLATIVFDGKQYRRQLPAISVPALEAAPLRDGLEPAEDLQDATLAGQPDEQ